MKIQSLIAAALLCATGATFAQAPAPAPLPAPVPLPAPAMPLPASQPQRVEPGALAAQPVAPATRPPKPMAVQGAHAKSAGAATKHKSKPAHKASKLHKSGKASKLHKSGKGSKAHKAGHAQKKAVPQGKRTKHAKPARPHRAPV